MLRDISVSPRTRNQLMPPSLVFFIDVDNTLLNNDRVKEEIQTTLRLVLGEGEATHFWRHHDEFRTRRDLVDFPSIVKEYCREQHAATCDMRVGAIFSSIDFAASLYPHALDVLRHLRTMGNVLIFTEGDGVYQKMKIEKSGIAKEADAVLLYVHKLKEVPKLAQQYLQSRMIFIDDRDDKLLRIKELIPRALTIVVCQGHYASPACQQQHTADRVIGGIQELLMWDRRQCM